MVAIIVTLTAYGFQGPAPIVFVSYFGYKDNAIGLNVNSLQITLFIIYLIFVFAGPQVLDVAIPNVIRNVINIDQRKRGRNGRYARNN